MIELTKFEDDFNEGDKVRILERYRDIDSYGGNLRLTHHDGKIATIINKIDKGHYVLDLGKEPYLHMIARDGDRMERVYPKKERNRFNLGDRVKILDYFIFGVRKNEYFGMIGNVINSDLLGFIRIQTDDGRRISLNLNDKDRAELMEPVFGNRTWFGSIRTDVARSHYDRVVVDEMCVIDKEHLQRLEQGFNFKSLAKKHMTSIINFAKNAALSADEKALRKASLKDSQGNFNDTAKEIVRDMEAVSLGFKDYEDMDKRYNLENDRYVLNALEYHTLFTKYEKELIDTAVKYNAEQAKK